MNKKGLKRILLHKNDFLIAISVLIVIGFLAYAFGAATFDSVPKWGGNYSGGYLFLNCTPSINVSAAAATVKWNATYFYNASNGTATNRSEYTPGLLTGNLTDVLFNQSSLSHGKSSVFNITIETGWLADGLTYNISCVVSNGSTVEWVSAGNITIDNTPPQCHIYCKQYIRSWKLHTCK